MDFFIQNTKQKQKLSVVLASSSSMFIRRILDHTINRASVFVIGDLSRNESKLFWGNYLPQKYPKARSDHLPTFEAVFDAVGGHMFHLEKIFCAGNPQLALQGLWSIAKVESLKFLFAHNP